MIRNDENHAPTPQVVTDTMKTVAKQMMDGRQQSCGELQKVKGEQEKLTEHRRFYVQVD
jgi:hypothetical protein